MTLDDIRKVVFPLKDILGCKEITIKVSPEILANLDKLIKEDGPVDTTGDYIMLNIVSSTGNKDNRKYPIREIVIVK